jgi:hypothetical protein
LPPPHFERQLLGYEAQQSGRSPQAAKLQAKAYATTKAQYNPASLFDHDLVLSSCALYLVSLVVMEYVAAKAHRSVLITVDLPPLLPNNVGVASIANTLCPLPCSSNDNGTCPYLPQQSAAAMLKAGPREAGVSAARRTGQILVLLPLGRGDSDDHAMGSRYSPVMTILKMTI